MIITMGRCCSHSAIEAGDSPKHTALHRTAFTMKSDITKYPCASVKKPYLTGIVRQVKHPVSRGLNTLSHWLPHGGGGSSGTQVVPGGSGMAVDLHPGSALDQGCSTIRHIGYSVPLQGHRLHDTGICLDMQGSQSQAGLASSGEPFSLGSPSASLAEPCPGYHYHGPGRGRVVLGDWQSLWSWNPDRHKWRVEGRRSCLPNPAGSTRRL